MAGYNQPGNLNWAPMNNAPATWQPNTQWPPPSNWSGYSQDRYKPVNNLLRVTGPESAKAYSVPPGSTVVLFDADNPIFYLLNKDDSGFPTLRTFRFEEEKPVEVSAVAETCKDDGIREEVESLKSDISEIKEMLEGLVK